MKQVFVKMFMVAMFLSSESRADELSGTWQFEKVSGFYGQKTTPVQQTVIQPVNGHFLLGGQCTVKVKKTKFDESGFVDLAKAGDSVDKIAKHLKKNHDFNLEKVKVQYRVLPESNCDSNFEFEYIYIFEDKLIVKTIGAEFLSFKRFDGGTTKTLSPSIDIFGKKFSHLPFDAQNYSEFCSNRDEKSYLNKCAPVYSPYWAKDTERDALTQLIGTHNYNKLLAEPGVGYDNPFAANLTPLFVILPPLNDVLIVHVTDMQQDWGDAVKYNRVGIRPVYITIKNLKVIDQITANCNINKEYFCVFPDGKKAYKLLDTGKFQKLK